MTIAITAAARTHVGLVRRRNEDCFHLGANLVAVADGMGGHVAGDVASSTVIDAIRPYDRPVKPDLVDATLRQAVHAASLALQQRITAQNEVAGMGTTLVAAMWSGDSFVIANVGDSRGYRLHAGVLAQVTDDHVYGRLLANAGNVPGLPDRLSRFLDGRAEGRSPDLAPLDVQPGDRLLLCSDGLSSFVPVEQIHAALTSDASPDDTADQLVGMALEQGAPDNVTVIVVDVKE